MIWPATSARFESLSDLCIVNHCLMYKSIDVFVISSDSSIMSNTVRKTYFEVRNGIIEAAQIALLGGQEV